VLIVDDLEDNRDLLATVLRDAGFVVTTASDGIEALEVAAIEQPRVVVMDLAMPRMDGYEATQRLRNAEYGRDVHVIVFSAFDDPVSRARAEEVGADAFLAKPCAPRDLVAQIEGAFAAMQSPRAAAG
jgi:CheY-like chemotaxis protein